MMATRSDANGAGLTAVRLVEVFTFAWHLTSSRIRIAAVALTLAIAALSHADVAFAADRERLPFQLSGLPSVANPYELVWQHEDGAAEGLTRFFLDINDDGHPDLFVAANSSIGNGSGAFHVFLRSGGSYRDLGLLPLEPEALELLESKHFDIHDVKTCAHSGGGRYQCSIYEFDGTGFRAAASGDVAAPQVLAELHPAHLTVERTGAQLDWKP